MNTKRTAALVGLLAAIVAMIATTAHGEDPTRARRTEQTGTTSVAVTEFADPAGDVVKPKLDLQRVRVLNRADRLKVRVYFPGVARTYDFPLGYVSVYLDTDASRPGPEYGHFMQFWSDYRFAPTKGWRELPTPEWSHSPEGTCVEYAGLQSDKQSRLRWFEYVVQKTDGCFGADAVRVAVTAANEGNSPRQPYATTYYDHLGARHAWTDWIPVTDRKPNVNPLVDGRTDSRPTMASEPS
jgi:hypothetical protein